HMPDLVPWTTHVWDAGHALAAFRKWKGLPPAERAGAGMWDVKKFIRESPFPILCMNSESITTPVAKLAITAMLKNRRCLMVVDESGDFISISGKRARQLMKWRNMAAYRRCLDGTPVGVSVFELYTPYRFLSPSILGFETFRQFQDAHAEWDIMERAG